jgi:CRISPR-associated protein Csx17
MPELLLDGCRLQPLAAYLKALGVLRLVGEQADAAATGRWLGDRFVLTSSLDADDLASFFVDRYCPTPLVSPWNGGSGFHPKDQQAGIAAIEASDSDRLVDYRTAIACCRALVSDPRWAGWEKHEQVRACRNALPDASLPWIDAAVVLTNDSRAFPPLLGTGGNVGRLEFSNNFMQNIAEALSVGKTRKRRRKDEATQAELVGHALFRTGSPALAAYPIGQFDPGGAGGANSSPFGDADSRVNPWDFLLTFEGALLFASGAARRLGASGDARAAMPFMVHLAAAGTNVADGENDKGELWAPVWRQPATGGEIARLVGEGRAEWGSRQAADGLDLARAVASLGVDRGIDAFERYTFVERHGQNMLAVPQGRLEVSRTARPEVGVLGQLDRWMGSLRRTKNLPNGVGAALHALERAQFGVAERSETAGRQIVEVLVAAGRVELLVARSGNLRREVEPCPPLPAHEWLSVMDGVSDELALALAVASQRDRRAPGSPNRSPSRSIPEYLRPIERRGRRWAWREGPPPVPGLGVAHLRDLLVDVLQRRTLDVARAGGERLEGQVGVQPAYEFATRAPVRIIDGLLDGAVDEQRANELLAGVVLLDFGGGAGLPGDEQPPASATDPLLALLVPFLDPVTPATSRSDGAAGQTALRPASWWWRSLRAGQVERVAEDAVRRLEIAGYRPLVEAANLRARGSDGRVLAAALAVPVLGRDRRASRRRVAPLPNELARMLAPDRTPGRTIDIDIDHNEGVS